MFHSKSTKDHDGRDLEHSVLPESPEEIRDSLNGSHSLIL